MLLRTPDPSRISEAGCAAPYYEEKPPVGGPVAVRRPLTRCDLRDDLTARSGGVGGDAEKRAMLGFSTRRHANGTAPMSLVIELSLGKSAGRCRQP